MVSDVFNYILNLMCLQVSVILFQTLAKHHTRTQNYLITISNSIANSMNDFDQHKHAHAIKLRP
jgi:hypothetical protein